MAPTCGIKPWTCARNNRKLSRTIFISGVTHYLTRLKAVAFHDTPLAALIFWKMERAVVLAPNCLLVCGKIDWHNSRYNGNLQINSCLFWDFSSFLLATSYERFFAPSIFFCLPRWYEVDWFAAKIFRENKRPCRISAGDTRIIWLW